MQTTKQQGFTLIEIAVVLLIVGLLLGGILKGQELVSSARVRNLINMNASVQAAYNGFYDRFGHLPGDWPATDATVAIGETITNGGVDDKNNGNIDPEDWGEAAGAWEQMSKSGFIKGTYENTSVVDDADKYKTSAPVNIYGGYLVLARNKGYKVLTGTASARLSLALGDNIPVAVAREIDVKLDDSKPFTGEVRAVDSATSDFKGVAVSSSDAGDTPACYVDTNDYNIVGDADQCNVIIIW